MVKKYASWRDIKLKEMQRLLITITAIIGTLLCYGQTPITQIEGYVEIHPSDDTTSVYIGKSTGQQVNR